MIEINCSNCKRPGQVLSSKGLCWDCYDSKEKQSYRYMVNSHTKLLFFTLFLCALFLMNAFPTVYLAHSFTSRYSPIDNMYIRHGKDILILAVYLILKLLITVNIWKSRYEKVGSKYINLAPEAMLFLIKMGFLISYLSNPSKWELRLSNLTAKLSNYTDDTLSADYLSFFLVFSFIFLMLRAIMCIAAYILNTYYTRYFQGFYQNYNDSKQINHLAHWDRYYLKHPIIKPKNDTPFVVSKVEKPFLLEEEFIRKDLSSYIKDVDQENRLLHSLLSSEDSISIKENDINLYYSYIKDKLSQWKEDNLSTDNYLDTDVIESFSSNFNSIKELFLHCSIENKTYYVVSNNYSNNFELPLRVIMNQRRNVKLMIEQLYTNANLHYQNMKSKEYLKEAISLLDKQVINLCSITLVIDDEAIAYDNILITNRGIFIIDIRTFDSSLPFEFLVDRDGSWLKRIYLDDKQTRFETLDAHAAYENTRHLLMLEKLINQELNHPLDQYMEVKHIVIVANDDLRLDNRSTQTIIKVGELMSSLRSHPIILAEDRMKQIEDVLYRKQKDSISYPIPNYRKAIIDQLDDLLDKKIQLIQSNTNLIYQVNRIANDLPIKHKMSFLPIIIHK